MDDQSIDVTSKSKIISIAPLSQDLSVIESVPVIAVGQRSPLIHDNPLGELIIPRLIERSGPKASHRFVEFFTANIRNINTRKAYALAIGDFLAWSDKNGIQDISMINAVMVAAYIESLLKQFSAPTVKQRLAAIRMLFDWFVTGGVIPHNPARSVRGPKHFVKQGLTPVLTAEETRKLIDSIETKTVKGLRDRALIGVMVYSFARVGAVVNMRVEDFYLDSSRPWFRLHEKGGKLHCVPAHKHAAEYVEAYIRIANIGHEKKLPLFRSTKKRFVVSENGLDPNDVLRMIKKRAKAAGLPESVCCHTFRATGITTFLSNGGRLENAQAIAAHESPISTKLYDRTNTPLCMEDVERIKI